MMIGFGALGLALLLTILICLAAIRRQILALPILLVGVGLFCFLAVTVFFQSGWPYAVTGISIYAVFFLAVIFSPPEGAGLVVRVLRGR
jgi:hypothetical protein